jgi:hypothetical protein
MSQVISQVDVTNASQTVTGLDTTWVTDGVEAGHEFYVSGEGVRYEVGSVDSETQITLTANYAGSTASDVTAVIQTDFTTRGIPELSEGSLETAPIFTRAMRRIDEIFDGEIEAGDIVGLGTAATADATTSATDTTSGRVWRTNDLVKTTSVTDTTAGRMLRVGDGGLLGRATSHAWDANLATTSFRSSLTGSPVGSLVNMGVHIAHHSTNGFGVSFAGRNNRAFFQTEENSVLQPWLEFWHSGNLVKTTSATDTTAGRMLQVGDGGINVAGWSAPQNIDLNDITASGLYIVGGGSTNLPSGFQASFVQSTGTRLLGQVQTILDYANTADYRIAWRKRSTSTGDWLPHVLAWHTGNLVKGVAASTDIPTRADADGRYARLTGGNTMDGGQVFTRTAGVPVVIRRPENDTSTRFILEFQSGDGSGNKIRLTQNGNGSNGSNILTFRNTSDQNILQLIHDRTAVFGGPVRLASYTVGTVPSASTAGAGAQIYVSNETGGATVAFSDGSSWRRVQDRAVIST